MTKLYDKIYILQYLVLIIKKKEVQYMKKIFVTSLFFVIMGCSPDEDRSITKDTSPPISVDETLTAEELNLMKEYEYVTTWAATLSEPPLSVKWAGELRLFLDGEISDVYITEISNEIASFNELFTDDLQIKLVDKIANSNVHLYHGPSQEIEGLWEDIYQIVIENGYLGFGSYFSNQNHYIQTGRIWVSTDGMPLFTHELGHVLGFGHASTRWGCGPNFNGRSFMCSGLSSELNSSDKAILSILHHPDIEVGKKYIELRPTIKSLLINDEIDF